MSGFARNGENHLRSSITEKNVTENRSSTKFDNLSAVYDVSNEVY